MGSPPITNPSWLPQVELHLPKSPQIIPNPRNGSNAQREMSDMVQSDNDRIWTNEQLDVEQSRAVLRLPPELNEFLDQTSARHRDRPVS
jgi:hypothetical protein